MNGPKHQLVDGEAQPGTTSPPRKWSCTGCDWGLTAEVSAPQAHHVWEQVHRIARQAVPPNFEPPEPGSAAETALWAPKSPDNPYGPRGKLIVEPRPRQDGEEDDMPRFTEAYNLVAWLHEQPRCAAFTVQLRMGPR